MVLVPSAVIRTLMRAAYKRSWSSVHIRRCLLSECASIAPAGEESGEERSPADWRMITKGATWALCEDSNGRAQQPTVGEFPDQYQFVAVSGCNLTLSGLSQKVGPLQSNFGVPFLIPLGPLARAGNLDLVSALCVSEAVALTAEVYQLLCLLSLDVLCGAIMIHSPF